MLKNYIKIGLKVLRRRPFYTFISLFGISITLMVMMLVYTLYQNSGGSTGVLRNFDRVMIVNSVSLTNAKTKSYSQSSAHYHLFDKYARQLKTPQSISIVSHGYSETFFKNKLKFTSNITFADEVFWQIFNHEFISGRSFNKAEVKNADRLAVLSESESKKHFGTIAVLGKELTIKEKNYRIIGVIKDVSSLRIAGRGDIILPVTCDVDASCINDLLGNYKFYFLAKDKSDFNLIEKEWNNIVSKIDVHSYDKHFTAITCELRNSFDLIAKSIDYNLDGNKLAIIASIVLILFMLLPALNLMSINITRILERSSEIGIRKSFGASRKVLIYQFLTENLILTFFGGILGFLITLVMMYFINNGFWLQNAKLETDYSIFIIGLLAVFVFNIFSGTYPAIRMSKLQIINALKEDNL
jgi:putative ABC transport system permease protein